jgi:hypothetical protein
MPLTAQQMWRSIQIVSRIVLNTLAFELEPSKTEILRIHPDGLETIHGFEDGQLTDPTRKSMCILAPPNWETGPGHCAHRISKAQVAYLNYGHIFTWDDISIQTKILVFKAYVLSTLYGMECYALTAVQLKPIRTFVYRKLKSILGHALMLT